MKIHLASDLHVEFHKNFPMPEGHVDVVVLAGDIWCGDRALEVAEKYHQHTGAATILLAGNHEFYDTKYHKQLSSFRDKAAAHDQVYFLEKDVVVLDNTRFLGCTLWTNFLLFGDRSAMVARSHAQQYIPDFKTIRTPKSRFTTAHAIAEFESAYTWLDNQLSKPFSGKTIVITHFLPHPAAVPSIYTERGYDHLTPYFASDCSDLMRKHSIDAWLFGHMHHSVDMFVENGTRLISNPRGYPHELWKFTRFDSNKIIEI